MLYRNITFLLIIKNTKQIMSTNGDLEMADANAGADVNDAEVELVEPQRIRVVSFFSCFFLMSPLFLHALSADGEDTLLRTANTFSRANLMKNSCLDLPTLLLHLSLPRKTTLLETLCDTLS